MVRCTHFITPSSIICKFRFNKTGKPCLWFYVKATSKCVWLKAYALCLVPVNGYMGGKGVAWAYAGFIAFWHLMLVPQQAFAGCLYQCQ